MGYKVEMEATQTQVDPVTGEVGIRSGERRPVGHEDVGASWKPVVVEVEDKAEGHENKASASEEDKAKHSAASPGGSKEQGSGPSGKQSGAK